MVKSLGQMVAAEVDAVIHTIHEPSCVTLHQSLKEGGLTVVDPEEMPSGQQVLSRLPPQKAAVKDHIITLFDSLSAATDHLSTAFVNLSLLAKISDEETFQAPDHYGRSTFQKNSLIQWWFQSHPRKVKNSSRRSGEHYCPNQVPPSW